MKRSTIFLCIIVFVAFILRFYHLATIPPGVHGDEGEFGLIAKKVISFQYDSFFSLADTGYIFGFSVLSFWVQGIFQLIFGETIYAIRFSSALAGTLTVVAFFFLARLFFKSRFICVLLTLALATSHLHIHYSRIALNNSWTPLFIVIIIFFLIKLFTTKKARFAVFSGISLGLSLYFAEANKVFPLLVLIFGIIHLYKIRKRQVWKKTFCFFLIVFFIAGIIYSPLASYFLNNPDVFSKRMNAVSVFKQPPEYYLQYDTTSVTVVLFRQFIETITVFHLGGDSGDLFYAYQGGLLAPIIGFFTLIGFIISFIKIREERSLFFLSWFFLVIILGGVITVDPPASQRLLAVIPVLLLFAGLALEKIQKFPFPYLKTILAILFLLNSYWDYHIYFKEYINSQAGWAQKEPATQIAYYLKSLGPDWKVYMLRENTVFYFRHGAIRFLNPHTEGIDILDSRAYIPIIENTEKNIVYIMPPNSPSLQHLRQVYPKGNMKYFANPIGNTPSFISFEIKNANLLAQ